MGEKKTAQPRNKSWTILENRADPTIAKDKSDQAAPLTVLPDPPSQEHHSQLPKESSGTP